MQELGCQYLLNHLPLSISQASHLGFRLRTRRGVWTTRQTRADQGAVILFSHSWSTWVLQWLSYYQVCSDMYLQPKGVPDALRSHSWESENPSIIYSLVIFPEHPFSGAKGNNLIQSQIHIHMERLLAWLSFHSSLYTMHEITLYQVAFIYPTFLKLCLVYTHIECNYMAL